MDEPLLDLMQEPRRLRFSLKDGLYVRLVDVPAALSARGYNGEETVVIDVTDPFCPWNEGRYAITTGPNGASCERTEAARRSPAPLPIWAPSTWAGRGSDACTEPAAFRSSRRARWR